MNITLRKLAVVDLSTTYARTMSETKIRHYRVPHAMNVVGRDPLSLIKEHIMREEGKEGSEIDFTIEATAALLPPMSSGKPLDIADVSGILKDNPKIDKALNKIKATSLIHQSVSVTTEERVLNKIATLVNPVVIALNKAYVKIRRFSQEELMFGGRKLLPYMQSDRGTRHLNVVRFLAVSFENKDYEEAQAALIRDLHILESNGLIMGHLTKPSLLALADVVGSGNQTCALFCFPIINQQRLEELLGTADTWTNRLILKNLGVQYEAPEGGINYLNGVSPSDKYNIETIYVTERTQDSMMEEVKETFDKSILSVNEATKITRALLQAYPEEFAKAEKELTNAGGAAHRKALAEARKKVAKSIVKKKASKKTKTKKKKVVKKAVKRKAAKKARR